MSTVYQQWSKLTTAEQLFLVANPIEAVYIRKSKDLAFQEAAKQFGRNGHNDKSDAFRHCFWSAILSRDIGFMKAQQFTTAHESDPANPPNERKMDLHNNAVGLKIGRDFWFFADSDDELSHKCLQALRDGKLMTSP